MRELNISERVYVLADTNKYMREYMATRRMNRREDLIKLLGGSCRVCKTTSNIEIDHIVKETKSFELSGKDLDRNWEEILLEAKKCQLLCNKCHAIKSNKERSVEHGKGLTGKRGCYCSLCKPLKQAYRKKYIRIR